MYACRMCSADSNRLKIDYKGKMATPKHILCEEVY